MFALQMLNCCIRHKTTREELMAQNPTEYSQNEPETAKSPESPSTSDDEDEFYDCDNASVTSESSQRKKSKIDLEERTSDAAGQFSSGRLSMRKSQSADAVTKSSPMKLPRKGSMIASPKGSMSDFDVSFMDSLTHQPEGRLRQCGDVRLLNGEDVLYIPVTQEPAPMTEDLLEEHAEVLAK